MSDTADIHSSPELAKDEVVTKKSWKNYFAFVKDRNFWKVLLLGQCKWTVARHVVSKSHDVLQCFLFVLLVPMS